MHGFCELRSARIGPRYATLRYAWLYSRGGKFVRRGVSLAESLRGCIERVVLRCLILSALRLLAGREPEASAVHLQDMNVMVKAVE